MDVFAANDLAAFITSYGSPIEANTAGQFNATYTSKYVGIPAGSGAITPNFIDPSSGANVNLTDVWVHFDIYNSTSGSAGQTLIELFNSSGVAVVRLTATDASHIRLDYWNGAAWVAGGSTYGAFPGNGSLKTFDLHVVAGAAGKIDFYSDQSLMGSVNGLNAAVDNFAKLRLNGAGYSSAANYSQILVSDTNTVGAKVASLTPNANGNYTAWANDYTNLVKTGYNDTTLISSTVLGDKETYAASDVTLPTAQYYVSSVFFAIRARLNSASPTNIKPLMRIGGVDYAGAYNFPQLNNISFAPSLAGFALDPSTGLAWSGVTNLNAAELGYQSAA